MCYKYLILFDSRGRSVWFVIILRVSLYLRVCVWMQSLSGMSQRLEDQVVEGGRGECPDRMSRGKTLQTDTRRSDSTSTLCLSSFHLSPFRWAPLTLCPPQGETQYSSHSSSNTLSSNASSSHSDERWFDGGAPGERGGVGCLGEPADPDPDLLNKGGSNDSGIDASTHYGNGRHSNMSNSQSHKAMHSSATYSGIPELSVGRSGGSGGEAKRRESSPIIPAAANQNKGYRTRTFPPPGSSADKMDAFKPR